MITFQYLKLLKNNIMNTRFDWRNRHEADNLLSPITVVEDMAG